MNKEKFFQYINDFNKGDYEKVVSTYYTEDIIFDMRIIGMKEGRK